VDRPLYSQLVSYYELLEGRDWKREIDLVATVLKDHGCRSVVDLGCGTGYHVRSLTKLGFKTTGVDISAQNIRFAKKRAALEGTHPHFVVGSYYEYHPVQSFDAALCLNWSIPVVDREIRRFFDNTSSLLQPEGLLILDYERVSDLAWNNVGRPILDSWDLDNELIARVSVGQVDSNVLSSRDIYLVYPKRHDLRLPRENSRYKAVNERKDVQFYLDHSFVRFFSPAEIRRFARASGFKVLATLVLPRGQYKRNYAVLEKVE
jgi:SAM-dependent methyltransferase